MKANPLKATRHFADLRLWEEAKTRPAKVVRRSFGSGQALWEGKDMGLPEASRPKDEVHELPALTALREHLTKVRVARAEWERTFDAIPDLIFILDRHHRIRRANRAAAQRLQLPFKELVGRPCYEVVHGLSRPPAWCPHVLALQDGSEHRAEVREDKANGWFLVTTTPLLGKDGRVEGTVHVARDITKRKEAEDALRASEALFRAVFENAAVGIAIADSQGRWIRFNRRFEEIIGHREEELFSKKITDVTHPEDRLKTLERIRAVREGREHSYRLEKRYIHKDGSVVWVDASVGAIRDPQGHLESLVGAIVDITEKKNAEDALKRMLRIEKQLSTICARFVSSTDTAAAIRAALKDLCLLAEADCAALALFGEDAQRLEWADGWGEGAWTHGAEGLEFLMACPWKERLDRGEKRWNYLSLPSIEVYLLVGAAEPRVEVYRKVGEGVVQEVRTEGRLLLPCVDIALDLAALYEGVELERA